MSTQDIQSNAPAGKFRVIGFALRDDHTYFIGDFEDLQAAKESAKEHGHAGNPAHVYDDRGELVVRYGSWQ